MTIKGEDFSKITGTWQEWQKTPWATLHYSVSRYNIGRHFNVKSARILDIGGGNGADTIYFAQQGHTVTYVDYSPAMLAEARKNAEANGVAAKITFHLCSAEDVPEKFTGQQYDLILCHLMIMFVKKVPDFFRRIAGLLPSGGLVSVAEINRYSEFYRDILRGDDITGASRKIRTKKYLHPWFKRYTPILSGEEIAHILGSRGFVVAGHYGIRCVNDYLPDDHKSEPEYYHALEKLELELTDMYPYYLLARMYHIIAKKS